ncbi:MAG: OsmC family protein [Gemmatimonadetes bacterium]|nr:OsmC family protein [Gemmatimonadota bacterium]
MTALELFPARRYASLIAAAAVLLFGPALLHAQETGPQGTAIVNGLDTGQLSGLIGALREHPQAGRVTFFSNSEWQDGMRAFTTFTGYRIDGEMHHERERQFVLLGDEGVELSGTDAAPGAVEELMYALGTCIIAAANANAALMGVELTRLEVGLESDLDLHGLFALDPDVRPGILDLRARITIAGDADEETLRRIAMLGYRYSPVSESIRNGVPVRPDVIIAGASADAR